jgi:phosphatidylserine/phosphatidylglycerophosphate/cardiolipin synthase-like enzyme
MKLMVQPGHGTKPLVEGIEKAKRSVQIVVFRFDRSEIERALEKAVSRGVFVHALIAYLNRGGEKKLRKLEMRLLAAGVTVARTSDDLPRYHDKFMIIDRQTLYLMAFNYTYGDIEQSRSFGLITKNRRYVQEAVKLFESDIKRQPYTPGYDGFVVSPLNARKRLAAFLKGAKQQLLIYDPKISDRAMIRILEERARAGVEVRIIGRLTRHSERVEVRRPVIHLHTRTIVRDRRQVFIGSQSLRGSELDARREVGIIAREPKVVAGVITIFEDDWAKGESVVGAPVIKAGDSAAKAAKKAAKAISNEMPPVTPIVEEAVKKVVGTETEVNLDSKQVEETLRGAIKEALKEVVKDAVQEAAVQKDLKNDNKNV